MTHPYQTFAYADTLSHVGFPVEVPEWGTCVIARPIKEEGGVEGGEDAIGTYPITVFKENADVAGGLVRLKDAGFISVTLVTDEWHRPDHMQGFDVVREFKQHFCVHAGHQQSFAGAYRPDREHRYKIRRSRRFVDARPIKLADHLDAWCGLYDSLVKRHILTGVHAFPRESFKALAAIEGIEAIGGFAGDELVCCNIWAVHEGRAHSHLVASSETGYKLRAAYAVTDAAVHHFADCDVVNLGGSAGNGDKDDGLAQFKRGFANSTSPAWLCGAILNKKAYEQLSAGKSTDYFPAYRC